MVSRNGDDRIGIKNVKKKVDRVFCVILVVWVAGFVVITILGLVLQVTFHRLVFMKYVFFVHIAIGALCFLCSCFVDFTFYLCSSIEEVCYRISGRISEAREGRMTDELENFLHRQHHGMTTRFLPYPYKNANLLTPMVVVFGPVVLWTIGVLVAREGSDINNRYLLFAFIALYVCIGVVVLCVRFLRACICVDIIFMLLRRNKSSEVEEDGIMNENMTIQVVEEQESVVETPVYYWRRMELTNYNEEEKRPVMNES